MRHCTAESSTGVSVDTVEYCRLFFFFFQAEDGIRDLIVTGVQTCALPIYRARGGTESRRRELRQPDLPRAPAQRLPATLRRLRPARASDHRGRPRALQGLADRKSVV